MGRIVRSASRNHICERRIKTATSATAFGVVAPKVWHDLCLTLYDLATLLHYLKRT